MDDRFTTASSADLQSITTCGDCRSRTERISRLTKLAGQRGRLGYYFAADASSLFFTWYEDDSDIWVMDVGTSTDK